MFDSPILLSCIIGCSFIVSLYGLFFALMRKRPRTIPEIFEGGAHTIGRSTKAYSLNLSPHILFYAGLIGPCSLIFLFLLQLIVEPKVEWALGLAVATLLIVSFGCYCFAVMRNSGKGEGK